MSVQQQLSESSYIDACNAAAAAASGVHHGASSIDLHRGISANNLYHNGNSFQHDGIQLPNDGISCGEILQINPSVYASIQPMSSSNNMAQSMPCQVRLPSYRPTPDYETVMRQRLEHMANGTHGLAAIGPRAGNVYFNPDLMSYSQPNIHQQILYQNCFNQTDGIAGDGYAGRFPCTVDVASGGSGGLYHPPIKPVDRTSSLIIYPSDGVHQAIPHYVPTSVVCVPSQRVPHGSIASYLYYRSPPPYPRQSNSTPDLATQMACTVSSNPDLLPPQRRQELNAASTIRSRFDQSMENLNLDVQQLQLCQQYSAQSKDNLESTSDSRSDHSGGIGLPKNLPDVAASSAFSCHIISTMDPARIDFHQNRGVLSNQILSGSGNAVAVTCAEGMHHRVQLDERSILSSLDWIQRVPDNDMEMHSTINNKVGNGTPVGFDNPAYQMGSHGIEQMTRVVQSSHIEEVRSFKPHISDGNIYGMEMTRVRPQSAAAVSCKTRSTTSSAASSFGSGGSHNNSGSLHDALSQRSFTSRTSQQSRNRGTELLLDRRTTLVSFLVLYSFKRLIIAGYRCYLLLKLS